MSVCGREYNIGRLRACTLDDFAEGAGRDVSGDHDCQETEGKHGNVTEKVVSEKNNYYCDNFLLHCQAMAVD